MSLFTKLFGTKMERNMKKLQPYLEKTNKEYEIIKNLSNDELRHKTVEFRQRIAETVKEEEARIAEIKKYLEENYSLSNNEKEGFFKELEALENISYYKTQEVLNEILPQAFAVMKETARRFKDNEIIEVTATQMDRDIAAYRKCIDIEGDKARYHNSWLAGGNMIKWNMCHYDEQLLGGMVLHAGLFSHSKEIKGSIAEMATGEGKTLVATLPVYLNALPGKGVHVVTVNDYLAKRDSEWMGLLYEFHGLTVDCIDKHEPNSEERRKAYAADITYGTNNEFGFDYLRDNMAKNLTELVQRTLNFALVDEVDSVLIDDARTPLIISGPTPRGDQQEFDRYKSIVEELYKAQKTYVAEILTKAKKMLAENPDPKPTDESAIFLFRAYRGLPKNAALIKFLNTGFGQPGGDNQGFRKKLLEIEGHYISNQKRDMPVIDDELYFVIEEKQNTVEITDKGLELISAKVEDEKMFIMPDVGTEIADLEKENLDAATKEERKKEIYRNFSIASERIHTVHQLLKAYTMFEEGVEYVIMDGKVKIVDEQTGRIMEGRRYSDGLHQAIEAKHNLKVEAATQTYATITLQNYFRMYKKLAGMTGTAETEEAEFWNIYKMEVVSIRTHLPVKRIDADDMVYKTKREKLAAVLNKIIALHNEGRPVLVGTTSVEDSELLSNILTRNHITHNVLNAKLHQKEAEIVAGAGQPGAVTISTNMAGRGTDIKLGPGVEEKGGLAIIGTERHESRRVDRQLRGRAGRQGDRGSSQFYVSLEDNLMRAFGGERLAKAMDTMVADGQEIQHSLITKSIEKAQKRVEENNFGIRKHLLEYDNIMNGYRTDIYNQRRNALYGDRLSIDISAMIENACSIMVGDYWDSKDFEGFREAMISTFGCEPPFNDVNFLQERPPKLIEALVSFITDRCKNNVQYQAEQMFPFVETKVYEDASAFVISKFWSKKDFDGFRQKTKEVFGCDSPFSATQFLQANPQELVRAFAIYLYHKIKREQGGEINAEFVEELYKQKDGFKNLAFPYTDGIRTLRIFAPTEKSYVSAGQELGLSIEKGITLSIIDNAWKEYLRDVDDLKQSAQNASYEQKDPLLIYKIESANMFAQMQERISTEVVMYLIKGYFPVTVDTQVKEEKLPESDAKKLQTSRQELGNGRQVTVGGKGSSPIRVEKKVGRNDPCPCGSGKKYKNCHGRDEQ